MFKCDKYKNIFIYKITIKEWENKNESARVKEAKGSGLGIRKV